MNHSFIAILRKQTPRFLAALAVTVMVTPAFANDPPLVQVSLASGRTISLGEPIVLDYTITNRSAGEAGVYLGHEKKSWLTINLLDQGGRVVATVPHSPPPEGFHFPGARVQRGNSFRGRLVVGQWLAVPRAGEYTLRVGVRLPYVIVHGGTAIAGPNSPTVVTTEYAFPLVVSAANPGRLRRLAESLRQTAVRRGDNNTAAIQSLFSLPDAYVLPSWRALIRDPRSRSFRYDITRQLERVPGAAATLAPDVLQYWGP